MSDKSTQQSTSENYDSCPTIANSSITNTESILDFESLYSSIIPHLIDILLTRRELLLAILTECKHEHTKNRQGSESVSPPIEDISDSYGKWLGYGFAICHIEAISKPFAISAKYQNIILW